MNRGIKLIALGAILGAAMAAPAAAIELTETKGRLECPKLNNTQDCAEFWERKLLATYPSIVRHQDGVLRIRRINGEWFKVPTSAECGDCLNAIDLQGDRRFVSIREQWSEGSSWHVFDRLTGRMTVTSGYPLVSPNSRTIVAAQEDLIARFSATVLNVYEVSETGLKLVYEGMRGQEYNPKWAPTRVSWQGDDTIAFKRTTVDAQERYTSKPASLTRRDGVWTLSR